MAPARTAAKLCALFLSQTLASFWQERKGGRPPLLSPPTPRRHPKAEWRAWWCRPWKPEPDFCGMTDYNKEARDCITFLPCSPVLFLFSPVFPDLLRPTCPPDALSVFLMCSLVSPFSEAVIHFPLCFLKHHTYYSCFASLNFVLPDPWKRCLIGSCQPHLIRYLPLTNIYDLLRFSETMEMVLLKNGNIVLTVNNRQ